MDVFQKSLQHCALDERASALEGLTEAAGGNLLIKAPMRWSGHIFFIVSFSGKLKEINQIIRKYFIYLFIYFYFIYFFFFGGGG